MLDPSSSLLFFIIQTDFTLGSINKRIAQYALVFLDLHQPSLDTAPDERKPRARKLGARPTLPYERDRERFSLISAVSSATLRENVTTAISDEG